MQLVLTLGLALLRLGADRALPRRARSAGQPADALVLSRRRSSIRCTQAPARVRRLLNLNPFTHLAVAYQEVLFRPGPFTRLATAARRRRRVDRACSWSATSCSIGCAIRSRRKCDCACTADRSARRPQGLSPLRAPQAVRDAEERAAVGQRAARPAARRGVRGAQRRVVRRRDRAGRSASSAATARARARC